MNGRIWIAPAGSNLAPALGELENGDLVVPEGDGVRIWPELKGISDITISTKKEQS